jgi:hypothetical protein
MSLPMMVCVPEAETGCMTTVVPAKRSPEPTHPTSRVSKQKVGFVIIESGNPPKSVSHYRQEKRGDRPGEVR